MAVIEIPNETEDRYEQFADASGATKDALVREHLLSFLDDLKDIAIATEHLANPGKTVSLEELRKELDLNL